MSGFTFDAKAALKEARQRQTDPNRPNCPNRSASEGTGLGRLGRLGVTRGLDPEVMPGDADAIENEISTVLSEGGKPVAQIMPEGNVHEVANTILQALRAEPDGNQAAIDACLAPYRDAIAMVAEREPVRKIHIDNLVKHKMRWRGF